MIRTLALFTVALLGLGVAPLASRPAAAALIERQDGPLRFHVYDPFRFSGGSATGEIGWYDFEIRLRGQQAKLISIATLFGPDGLVVNGNAKASYSILSVCCAPGGGRVKQPFRHVYYDEEFFAIGRAVPGQLGSINPPLILRVKVLAAQGPYDFAWNGRMLPLAPARFNIEDHGFDGTILDANGIAVTPAPAAGLLLLPGLVALAALRRRRTRLRG